MEKDMEYYIRISSEVMLGNLDRRELLTKEICDRYLASGKNEICIIASGSSLNAAMSAEPFLRKYFHRADILSPTEYIGYRKEEMKDRFFIVISQSGCSTNIIEAVKELKECGLEFTALTGNPDGDLKDYTSDLIEYGVGNEVVDYVTLGMVTLIEFLILFALEAAKRQKTISEASYEKVVNDIRISCQASKELFEKAVTFTDMFYDHFFHMDKAFIIADGSNMGIAREAALKFGETLRIPAMYYESEEYIHGPNMQLTPDYFVFFIDTNPKSSRMQEVFRATLQVTEHAFLITNKKGKEDQHIIKAENEVMHELTPLFTAVPFQYIAAHVTKEKNDFKCHPLFDKFEEMIHCKTDDYEKKMEEKRLQAKEDEE